MKRTGYQNSNMPPVADLVSWGINLEGVKDMFIVTGHAAMRPDNSSAYFVGDAAAQTRWTLEQMEITFSQAGYTKHDIVSVNWSVDKDVTEEQSFGVFDVWQEYIADVEVKPAGGTWKRVYGLLSPEILVEIEMMLAR